MGPRAHRLRRPRLPLRRAGLRRADQGTGGHQAHHRRPPRRHRRGRGPQAGCPSSSPVCAPARTSAQRPAPKPAGPTLAALARRYLREHVAVRCKPSDRSPVPPRHRAPYRPRPRHAPGLRHRAARRRRPPALASRPPGHGQPGGGDAVPNDRPGASLGRRRRGGQPLPLRPEIQGGPARALPHRCRVPALRPVRSTSWRGRGASRPMRRPRCACSCSPAAGGTRSSPSAGRTCTWTPASCASPTARPARARSRSRRRRRRYSPPSRACRATRG